MATASKDTTSQMLHRGPSERVELGRAARGSTPRSAHAEYQPAPDRPDPIDLLESQAATRVTDLVAIRYGRMQASPFAFFRGSALIMASDLAGGPRSGLEVQLCGDAHLSNFGLFASPERNLVFDINDFDETLPGPFEWDVKRLAASLAVAGRENGYDRRTRMAIVRASVAAYREHMRERAAIGELEAWYSHTLLDLSRLPSGLHRDFERTIRRSAAKARSRGHLDAHAKLTRVVGGRRRLISDPPLIVPIGELIGAREARRHEQKIEALMQTYLQSLEPSRRALAQRYRYTEMARKVVGVGSVGARAWILLLVGRDDDDPLVMQVKEAQPSVLEAYLGPSEYTNAGQRVVTGQRLMQAVSDILLGWLRTAGPDGYECDYYVRQLRDWKGGAVIEGMRPKVMLAYGQSCGRTLARAHARTGDRIALAAYLGKGGSFDRAVARFAEAYADQNERDFTALREAIASGRVAATVGL